MIIKTGLISRVAFSIAGIDIYWYAILIVSAIVIGINILRYFFSVPIVNVTESTILFNVL